MKYFFYLILAVCAQTGFGRNETMHDTKITMSVINQPLKKVFEEIKRQTDYRFNFSEKDVSNTKNVTFEVKDEDIETVLKLCVKNQPIDYMLKGKLVIIKKSDKNITLKAISIPEKIPNTSIDQTSESFTSEKILDKTIVIGYGTTSRKLNTSNTGQVTAKDFYNQTVDNFLAGASGRVPGFSITQTNGLPGAYYKTQINGQSSIGIKQGRLPFNDPLFVIDGVPYAANNNSIQVNGSGSALGINGKSALISIDPDNIESITILKDADGTSIYGSRGAKGVVLITTKHGNNEKSKVDFNIKYGVSSMTRTPDMLNTPQYMEMRREAIKNDNQSPSAFDDIQLLDSSRNINFRKELLNKLAKSREVFIAVSRHFINSHYYFSANYQDRSTVYSNDLSEIQGNLHFYINYKLPKNKFNTTLVADYTNNINQSTMADITNSLVLLPNSPPLYDEENNENWGQQNLPFNNPLGELYKPFTSRTKNMLLSVTVNCKITKHLSAKTMLGFNSNWTYEKSIITIRSLNPYLFTDRKGTLFAGKGVYKIFIIEPQLEYWNYISKGKITMKSGISLQDLVNKNNKFRAEGFTDDNDYTDFKKAANIVYEIPLQSKYLYRGLFERISYNWLDKYIVNITGRHEWSNRMMRSGQLGHFLAVGTGWIFSNEPFFKGNFKTVSFGKVRFSAGTTGNDQSGNYQYFDNWGNALNNGVDSSIKLKWEITRKLNGGIVLGFFQDRLYMTLDYFKNRTKDQLISMPAGTASNSTVIRNWPAIVENAGFELAVRFKNKAKKNLSCDTEISFTLPRNTLIAFPGLTNSPYRFLFRKGESLTVQQGYHSLGVDPKTGLYHFEDRDGDGQLSFPNDYMVAGNLDAKVYAGLKCDFSYKNWHAGFFMEGKKQKGYGYVYAIYGYAQPGTPMINQPVAVFDRWKQVGDIASFQRFSSGSNNEANMAIANVMQSDVRFTDASYLRIKNIYLSFYFPEKWLSPTRLRNASVYFQMYNYFTITNYKMGDPETQSLYTMPPLKSCVFGIRLGV